MKTIKCNIGIEKCEFDDMKDILINEFNYDSEKLDKLLYSWDRETFELYSKDKKHLIRFNQHIDYGNEYQGLEFSLNKFNEKNNDEVQICYFEFEPDRQVIVMYSHDLKDLQDYMKDEMDVTICFDEIKHLENFNQSNPNESLKSGGTFKRCK